MPNGTYGGVRGRKMKVGGNDYIIFLLLDFNPQRNRVHLGRSPNGMYSAKKFVCNLKRAGVLK